MPCVTRLRRICSKNRSGMALAAASWLHGTGAPVLACANCSVAWTAYSTVRDSFMILPPERESQRGARGVSRRLLSTANCPASSDFSRSTSGPGYGLGRHLADALLIPAVAAERL